MPKDFMSSKFTSGGGGDFGGGGATGTWESKNGGAGRGFVNPTEVNTAGAGRGNINPPNVVPNDAYVHETDNIVASGQTPQDEAYALNIKFQPNILDNYDVYTYHWKLFLVDPATAASGKILDLNNQTIIAESGVSDLTIDKVNIKGITTPSIETGTGVSTDVKFEIVEPSGAGLIDKIFYQAIGLGIGNWSTMPVYLQLQFRGRDPESSEALLDGMPGSISSLKWVWALKLTSIKANVTTVGTRYDFEAIVYNELAQSNAYFTLQSNITLENLTTVGKAMSELQDKMNADQLLKLIDNYSIPDTFKIIVDPKLAIEKITPINNNTDSIKSNNMSQLEWKDGFFSSGTAVDKIIDSVLAHAPGIQAKFVGAPSAGQEGLPANALPSQMKPFWRIITESRPIKFDPRRMDDAREFTIFVIEYDVGILDSNVFQEPNGPETIEAERKRLVTYLKKSILKKKYNYIFTGLNDQIINLDLTVNNAFAVSQARMGGIYSNLAMASKGRVMQNNASVEANVTEKLSAAISLNNSAKTANSAASAAAAAEARAAIDAADLPEETKLRYKTLLDQSKPESRTNFLQDTVNRGGINNDGTLNSSRIKATNLAKPQTEKITGQQLRFISDVNGGLNDPETASVYKDYLTYAKGKLRPIAHVEQLHDKQIGMGIESSSNSGIQKLSSMFSVALHSGLDSSFQKIKLTIKGDPFWLFPQPITNDVDRPFYNSLKTPAVAIDWIKNAHFRMADSANYYGTDNFLIIRFRTPRIFNIEENDNDVDAYNEVATFSGVYKVTNITSSFAAGKFTQEIDCILDPFINLVNFTKEIEGNAAKKDVPTTPNDLKETNAIPTTAVKQAKLPNAKDNQKGVVSDGATATTLGPKLAAYGKTAREQGQAMLDAARKGK